MPDLHADCRTIAGTAQMNAAASGEFSAHHPGEVLVAKQLGPVLQVWSAGRQVCSQPWEAPMLCLHTLPSPAGSADMVFALGRNLEWQVLQLQRGGFEPCASGALTLPVCGTSAPLFGCAEVQCCRLPGDAGAWAILLSVWSNWLTVLDVGAGTLPAERRRQTDVPLAKCGDALPVSGALAPRILQLATWADANSGCESACDPCGNPAVAIVYADDTLQVLHLSCVNIDLAQAALLPGPWELQNIGITELERQCVLVPVRTNGGHRDAVPAGVLVVGQVIVPHDMHSRPSL
jgi:hypothetical protein